MKNYFLWALIPLSTVAFQYFTKQAAITLENIPFGLLWVKTAINNPFMIAAIITEIIAFFAWMKILGDHDLSRAFPLTAISYVLVIAMGWIVFKEPITAFEIIGCGLILSGIWLVATATPAQSE